MKRAQHADWQRIAGNNGDTRLLCKEIASYKDGCVRNHQGCESNRLSPFEGLTISSPRLYRG